MRDALHTSKRRLLLRLLGLLVLYVSLALTYWVVTPVYEGPDEPMHYAYVRHLVETRRLPPVVGYEGGHPAHQETSQPPLYYVTATLLTSWAPDQGDYATLLERNPHFAYPAPPTVPDNKNTWLHTAAEAPPWRGTVLAIRLTRLVSLLFGALGVLATWGLGRELWPSSEWLPLAAAGVAAFIPQFLFMSAVVTNDTAAMALSACVLWAVARTVRRIRRQRFFNATSEARGASKTAARWAVLLGLLLGLAALTKVSVLGLILLVSLLLLAAMRRYGRVGWRTALLWLGTALGVAALVGGWWYLRNWFLYGSPFNLHVHRASPWAWETPRSLWAALRQLGGVERSFWGMFGTGNVGFPDAVYTALRVGWLLALAGWVLLLLRQPPAGATAWIWGLLWAWVLLVLVLQVRWMRLVLAPWGRLLFPSLACLACLLLEGWRGWTLIVPPLPTRGRHGDEETRRQGVQKVPRLRWGWMGVVPVAGLLLLSVLAPPVFIRPAYARPQQLTSTQVAARAHSVDFRIGNLARLIGYDFDRTSLPPGDWLTVTLCWEVVESTPRDHTLFVQLIGMDGGLVASRHTFPGQGRFPTSQWRPGDRFCDETRVYVDERTPSPAVYYVEIGLLDRTGDSARLPVYAAQGAAQRAADKPLDSPLFLDRVRVGPDSPRKTVLPVLQDDQDDQGYRGDRSYRLGDTLALVGYETSLLRSGDVGDSYSLRRRDPVHAGTSFDLTLYWQATAPPEADYITFVHLLDLAGEIAAQVDRRPRDGRYPTSFWMPGEVVSDTFTLSVPAAASPGHYRLVGGMYTWPDLARLPVVGPDGQPQPENLLELGSVVVN